MMHRWSPHPYLDAFRILVALVLGAACVAVVLFTYRWPLAGDAQIFHYIHLLTQHGFVPYRDIPDINMPGCYVLEDWAMRLFGGSDLSWRIYEFTLFGILTLAMIVIARTYDWVAGFFASIIFILQHVMYGPRDAVERDEVIAILIMMGYAFLFESLRRRKPWLSFGFGLSLGLACTIKPIEAPLFLVLLVMAAIYLRGKGLPIACFCAWSIAGPVIAGGYVLLFLLRQHVLESFFYEVKTYTSLYTGMDKASAYEILHNALPMGVGVIVLFAIVAAGLKRTWRNWELWAIGVGVASGAVSYFVQGKGFRYHAYPLVATLLLWASIELAIAMHEGNRWARTAGIAGIAVGVFLGVPTYLHRLRRIVPQNEYTLSIESDLTRMGGPALNRQVECLDIVEGCFSALYHLRLIQNNGNMGDLLLFTPHQSPVIDRYRTRFLNELAGNPPGVIILSNEWFFHPPNFGKVDQWPQFDEYLRQNYHLVATRHFQNEWQNAYRIYVRNGFVLPRNAGSTGSD